MPWLSSAGRSGAHLRSGQEQGQAADGVRDHQGQQGELPRDGASGREEADGPVVGCDDAEDVPDDDGGDLERGDAAGGQGWFGRDRIVSAECHHDCTCTFGYEECEVVGDEIAEGDRDERVREGGEGVAESAGDQPGGTGAEGIQGGDEGDGGEQSERGAVVRPRGEVWTVVIQEGASEKPS